MYNELTYNGNTYRFESRWVSTSEGNFEDYDIMINGNKSNYELQTTFWVDSRGNSEKIQYTLFRNGYGTGVEINNPTSLTDMSKIVSSIIYYELTK